MAGLLVGVALGCTVPAYADECSDIVEDTVAEARAGLADSWNSDLQTLVRVSAASACVKALSGRYTKTIDPVPAVPPSVTSAGLGDAAADVVLPRDSTPAAEVVENTTGNSEQNSEQSDGWTFGGLKFRSMSGSPGRKPYERNRESSSSEESGDSEEGLER
ncbi:MAG: hypothetical protein AB8B57_00775 [Congregibacter sp.]